MKKKKSKGSPNQPMGPYKRFLKDFYELLTEMDLQNCYFYFSPKEKHEMFDNLISLRITKAANPHVNSKEIKLIDEQIRKCYRQRTISIEKTTLSVYHLWLMYMFYKMLALGAEKTKENESSAQDFREFSERYKEFCITYLLNDLQKVIYQWCNPDIKYYMFKIDVFREFKAYQRIVVNAEINGIPAEKCMLKLNGHNRPAFRLATKQGHILKWISIDPQILCDFYKGNRRELDVYIQSHALQRLKERLDLLDQGTINYTLWINTQNIEHFEVYNNYLLLPFKLYDIKVGYLVANIIDHKLLFRTFLFVTHNCTPEGDLLKTLTGLEKQDIQYWRIDRLSTFIALDEQKHADLIRLFEQAGIGHLSQLKNKKFNVESMQTGHLDGFMEYISRSVKAAQDMEEQLGAGEQAEQQAFIEEVDGTDSYPQD